MQFRFRHIIQIGLLAETELVASKSNKFKLWRPRAQHHFIPRSERNTELNKNKLASKPFSA